MADIIRTEGLTRTFKSGKETVRALKGIDLSIKSNTLTILRGRSGSGKTTLINLLGILDVPTEGKIFYNNQETTGFSEVKRDEFRRTNIGFVFQSVALISLMSAYENVEFGLRVAEYSCQERKRRAEECLKMVGLGMRMKHLAHEMSGGEQQRVAIARAIAHRPKVIFADEPTAELDTLMGLHIVKIFKSLVRDEGITVVMTTHDPNMMDIADNVLTLEDGEIIDER